MLPVLHPSDGAARRQPSDAIARSVRDVEGTIVAIMFLQRGTCVNLRAGGFALLFHVSDAKPAPPEEVRDNQRFMPGEGVIDLTGFFQALKKIGYEDGVSPEPLGRVPAEMPPEEGARLGLETTLAVMRKAGVIP